MGLYIRVKSLLSGLAMSRSYLFEPYLGSTTLMFLILFASFLMS